MSPKTQNCLMQKGTCCELFFSWATVRVIGKTFVKTLVEKTKRLSRNKETYPKSAPSKRDYAVKRFFKRGGHQENTTYISKKLYFYCFNKYFYSFNNLVYIYIYIYIYIWFLYMYVNIYIYLIYIIYILYNIYIYYIDYIYFIHIYVVLIRFEWKDVIYMLLKVSCYCINQG